MAKLKIGDGSGGDRLFVPAQRDVQLYLQNVEHMEADAEKGYKERLRWDFQLIDGPDLDDEFVDKIFAIYTTLRAPGKDIHPRSNLYGLLESMSGGTFDAGDEIDTDDYVGREFIGDFKLVDQQENVGTRDNPVFQVKRDQDKKAIKKSELTNIHPPRPAREPRPARTRRQETFDWDDDNNDTD